MSQPNLAVTSREFKLMLNADRFQDRAAGAAAFWKLVEFIVEKKEGGRIIKRQDEEDAQRLKNWLDREIAGRA